LFFNINNFQLIIPKNQKQLQQFEEEEEREVGRSNSAPFNSLNYQTNPNLHIKKQWASNSQ